MRLCLIGYRSGGHATGDKAARTDKPAVLDAEAGENHSPACNPNVAPDIK